MTIDTTPDAPVDATPQEQGSQSDAVSDAAGLLQMKKKELIDLVVTRSGIRKKSAKPVVEAMLEVLGEAVAEGREFNLQPLGRLRINRSVVRPNGRVTVCKLRQRSSAADATETLAEAAD